MGVLDCTYLEKQLAFYLKFDSFSFPFLFATTNEFWFNNSAKISLLCNICLWLGLRQFGSWKPFKNDKKWFLFHLKIFKFLIMYKNDFIRNIRLKPDSHPKKIFIIICLNDSLSKMMKNAFYFIFKVLFVLQRFKVLLWLFEHVEKTAWLERQS